MKTGTIGVFLVVLLFSGGVRAQSAAGNPGMNGSFEEGEDSPVGWTGAISKSVSTDWVEGSAHCGTRAVSGVSRMTRAAWTSSAIPVSPTKRHVAGGWIEANSGSAWIEVTYVGADGKRIAHWKSSRVSRTDHWSYVAVDIEPLVDIARGETNATAEIAFWVKDGSAKLDDITFHPTPSVELINSGFEMAVDNKGRVPYWNEEEDSALLEGTKGGSFAREDAGAPDNAGSLVLTATEKWFAFTSINYPIQPWTEHATLTAYARCGPNSQAQLLLVWIDSDQSVLRVDASPESSETDWHDLVAGPFEPPEGAFGIRPVLAVTRTDGAGGPATAHFDRVDVDVRQKEVIQVLVNQVGYNANGPKTAIVQTNYFPKKPKDARIELLDESGQSLFDASLTCVGRMYGEKEADWGWYFWKGSFDFLDDEGDYRVRATFGRDEGVSHPFRIGKDVLFQQTAAINVDFFHVQRCGTEVPGWHAACHLDDAKLKDGTHLDLTGGWHSAGDYNKLNWEYGDGGVCYALVTAAEAAPDYFAAHDRDGDGLPDILDEAWWGAKFLAKVQIPETGGVLNHIEQGPDRKTWMNWCPPEKTTDNIPGTADDPIVIEGAGSSPLGIGAWARLARILRERGIETDYLPRAVRLWEHATANGTAVPNPLLLISSVDLYNETKEERYLTYCHDNVNAILATGDPEGQLAGGYGESGDIPAAALAYFALAFPEDALAPAIKDRLAKHLPPSILEASNPLSLMKQKRDPDGYYFEPTSAMGCNYQLSSRAWSALMVYRVTGDWRGWSYAMDQLDFLLGRNPHDLCMMEGVGSRNLPRYHHRYITIPGHERGAVPGTIPNGFVRDIASNDRPGVDFSTGGRLYPSYRTNEPWLVHNVFYTLAVTALHDVIRESNYQQKVDTPVLQPAR
jgi:hypothetical protein